MKNKLLLCILLLPCLLQAQDTVSVKDLPAAARLMDLNFTQKEIDTMYAGVKENILVYKLMHQQTLNNNVPMSLWHSPVVPGMKFNEKQENINWDIPRNVSLPADRNDLAYYSIRQLASLIKKQKNQFTGTNAIFSGSHP